MGRTLLQVARRGTTRHVSVIQSDRYDQHNRLVDDGFQVRYLDLEEAFERGEPGPKRYQTPFDKVEEDYYRRRKDGHKPDAPLGADMLDQMYHVLIKLSCASHHPSDNNVNDAISKAIGVVYDEKMERRGDMDWWDKGTARDGGKL